MEGRQRVRGSRPVPTGGSGGENVTAELIAEIASALTGVGNDPASMLRMLARFLAESTGDTCAIVQPAGDGSQLVQVAGNCEGGSDREQTPGSIGEVPIEAYWRAIHTQQALDAVVESTTVAGSRQAGASPVFVVPIRARGRSLGSLALVRAGSRPPYGSGERALIQVAADMTGAAVDSATLADEVERLGRESALEIAERKGAEELLARQASVLQEQADFLDLTHDAILVRDLEARISFWNLGAQDRYGWRAEEVLGKDERELLHPQYEQPIEAIQAEFYRTGRWEGEVVHARRDGSPIVVFSRWALQRDDDGQPAAVLEISSDITELKLKEATLARQGERLQVLHEIDRAILEAQSPRDIAQAVTRRVRRLVPCQCAAVMVFDHDREQAHWLAVDAEERSPAAAGEPVTLGAYPSLDTLLQGGIAIVEDLASLPQPTAREQALLATGLRSVLSLPLSVHTHLLGALELSRGAPGPFGQDDLAVASQVADSLAVAMQNARLNEEVRASRQRLQNLSRRLAELQEHERQRIANELYDDAGQRLAALLVRLRVLEQELGFSDEARAEIGEMKHLADGVLADLHHLAVEMRPASLDKLGLVPALRQYLDEIGHEYGLATSVAIVWPDDLRLARDAETTLYRAIQEALTNVVRHAHASTIGVVLRHGKDTVMGIVEDDGVGFDPTEAIERGRLGLFGMRQRVEDLGGTLTIESAPGQGTTIYVEMPVR